MKKTVTKKLDGFTIIEVVLVLAIAGLIFLMVFIALPALQANQADGQRRSDAGRFISQIQNYKTNSRGAVPTVSNVDSFVTDYLKSSGGTFNDPKGDPYTFVADKPTQLGQIQYKVGAICNDAGNDLTSVNADSTAVGSRQVGILVKLTTGVYCAST